MQSFSQTAYIVFIHFVCTLTVDLASLILLQLMIIFLIFSQIFARYYLINETFFRAPKALLSKGFQVTLQTDMPSL